jgi:hypothetical protein
MKIRRKPRDFHTQKLQNINENVLDNLMTLDSTFHYYYYYVLLSQVFFLPWYFSS